LFSQRSGITKGIDRTAIGIGASDTKPANSAFIQRSTAVVYPDVVVGIDGFGQLGSTTNPGAVAPAGTRGSERSINRSNVLLVSGPGTSVACVAAGARSAVTLVSVFGSEQARRIDRPDIKTIREILFVLNIMFSDKTKLESSRN
jgi:hypothetical protein